MVIIFIFLKSGKTITDNFKAKFSYVFYPGSTDKKKEKGVSTHWLDDPNYIGIIESMSTREGTNSLV